MNDDAEAARLRDGTLFELIVKLNSSLIYISCDSKIIKASVCAQCEYILSFSHSLFSFPGCALELRVQGLSFCSSQ